MSEKILNMQPVILSGGSGSRLWPLSRDHLPKQFLSLIGDGTMLQQTWKRLDLLDVCRPVVVCNEAHRFLVLDQMREIDAEPMEVVIEPVGRNTAPALTLATLSLVTRGPLDGADPLMLVLPSDSIIKDESAYREALLVGEDYASEGFIVTFGVNPAYAHTGYGYIQKGEALGDNGNVHRISGFVEKPDLDNARIYLESGEWLWNGGMFMLRASVWLKQLENYRPDILDACKRANANGQRDGLFYRPGSTEFIECPTESIDYAVLESAGNKETDNQTGYSEEFQGCAVVSLDAGWSDIGAWSVLWEQQDQDEDGNVVQGDVYSEETENSLLISQHRLLATLGVKDTVVIETPDAVLVSNKEHVQDVRKVVERLKQDGRPEPVTHRRVHRPWGNYEVVDSGPGFQVKRLSINPGAAISLQKHSHRAEHWVVVVGTARVTRGDEVFFLRENQSTYVSSGTRHRLENPEDSPLEIIEVQTGLYLQEDDIIRFDDDYNRGSQD